MIGLFQGRFASVILVPMSVIETALILMVIVACVDMLERSLREGKQNAHYHAEMKEFPHSSPVYTPLKANECCELTDPTEVSSLSLEHLLFATLRSKLFLAGKEAISGTAHTVQHGVTVDKLARAKG